MNEDLVSQMCDAVDNGDADQARQLLTRHPCLLHHDHGVGTWLHAAAHDGSVPMVRMLVEMGCKVNAVADNSSARVPLENAILADSVPVTRFLLEHGADPNYGRMVIGAIVGQKENSLELVKLLEEYGADLHKVFVNEQINQPMNALSAALDWDKTDVADYLRSRGAVSPDREPEGVSPRNLNDEVVEYFESQFGPVQRPALIEIVPTEPLIVVHVVPASTERSHITLFTTGVSSQPMTVPADGEEYRYAELFIQLPSDWRLTEALSDLNFGWPIHWLRSLGKYPHQQTTWLGGPVTIVANGEPAQPLALNVRFTAVLLLAERLFVSREGRKIQLYRLTPIYPEEHELEATQGIASLMRAFDQSSISFVVNLNRRNVATG